MVFLGLLFIPSPIPRNCRGTILADLCIPKELVHEYQEYALGDPRSDGRRVVLDSSMLKEVDDVITFRPRDLLDRFLSYVADASGSVKGTQRPLLLLVFGNGTERSYSITIGGGKKFDDCTIRLDKHPGRRYCVEILMPMQNYLRLHAMVEVGGKARILILLQ